MLKITRKFLILRTRYFLRYSTAALIQPEAQHEEDNKLNFSFMANLFLGNVVAAQVFPYPDILSSDDKLYTRNLKLAYERFYKEHNNAAKNDINCKIYESTLDRLWELGGFGAQVPEEYGGLGINNTQYGCLAQIMGYNDLGLAAIIGAHQNIGFKGILLYGTSEQKLKYLTQVSFGKVFAAFALTESSAGSDASSIRSTAVKTPDGKNYILNGTKVLITNGAIANIFTVFAKTAILDESTNKMKENVTAFIMERSFGGIRSGAPEKKMGINASNTTDLFLEDVKVPVENVLGKEGDGIEVAMNILNSSRSAMSAMLSGSMKYCIEKVIEHVNKRMQFGKRLKEYEGIKEKIAQMNLLFYVADTMAFAVSQNMDAGSQDFHLEAAISKVFASESAWYVCDEAIQIFGGMGYIKQTGLERVLRDLRIFRIYEGTNDVLRLFVALTGIQYAGSHLKELQKAFKKPATNLGLIFKEASRRAASTVGLGGVDLSPYLVNDLYEQGEDTADCIDMFGHSVESLLSKYGENIVHEQNILNRLADAAIDIYSMVVVLSRATRAVEKQLPTTDHELNMTKAWCYQACERCRLNLRKTTAKQQLQYYKQLSVIANTVTENSGPFTTDLDYQN